MSIVIDQVPANQLTMLGAVQLDRIGTSPGPARNRTYIVGQKTSSGTATANTPVQVSSVQHARGLFGRGSHLALMVEAYHANHPTAELWCIPVADNGSGTAAVGSIQVTAAATGPGTISLYIAGQLVQVGVAPGDGVNTIAAAISAAINDELDLPVTATVSTDTVTITCRHKGTLGNEIDTRINYRTGECLPSGVALSITQVGAGTAGATDPTLTTANTALASAVWRWLVYPYTSDSQVDALDTIMFSRWDAMIGLQGAAFSGYDDTVANLTTWSGSRNSPHHVTVGCYASPTPTWQVGAAYAGACVRSLEAHASVPLLARAVAGVLAPDIASRFTETEINTLGLDGVATFRFDSFDQPRIANAVTHYKTDSLGAADTTLQFVNAPAQLMVISDRTKALIASTCAGKILVDDASLVSPGTPVIDTEIIAANVRGLYGEMVRDGLVEAPDEFADALVVERDGSNANRINILMPPDLANQLNVVGVLLRPYLQFRG